MNNGSDYINRAYENTDEGMRLYDSLPPPVRRVIANGEYPFVVASIVKSMRMAQSQRMPFAKWLSRLRRRMAEGVLDEALHTYGPTHPQARRVKSRGRS